MANPNKHKRVFIIHGWGGNPEEGWFPWLKKELEKIGFQVIIPLMPNPDEPKIIEWVSYLSEVVGKADEDTFLIGHSIGCQTILRFLETLTPEKKIGGVVFVAGWLTLMNLNTEDEQKIAEPWLNTIIDFNKVKSLTSKFYAIFSDNDNVVPIENITYLKKNLGAITLLEHNKGHFSGDDEVVELPIVLQSFLSLI